MQIRVNPDILNQSGNNLISTSSSVQRAGSSANSAASSAPSYDGQFGPKVKAIGNEARAIANGNAEELTNHGKKLLERATIFQTAD